MSLAAADNCIRVLLVIENRLLRETIVRLFHKRSEFSLVGRPSSPAAALESNPPHDVRVLDSLSFLYSPITFTSVDPAPDGAAAIVLIGMEEKEQQFFTAIRSGISAYLLKDASADEVVAAVRSATRGEAVCPPRLCLALFRRMAASDSHDIGREWNGPKPILTIRQQKLISLVAQGLTNKEIATRLNLSEYTVRNSLYRIMKQVEARSRSEAVQFTRMHGYSLGI